MWFKAEYNEETGIFHVDIESGEDPPDNMWAIWENLIGSVIYDIARHRQIRFEEEGKDRPLSDEILSVMAGVELSLVHKRHRDRNGEVAPLQPRLNVVDSEDECTP